MNFQKKSDVRMSMQESTELHELLKKLRVEKFLGEERSRQDMEKEQGRNRQIKLGRRKETKSLESEQKPSQAKEAIRMIAACLLQNTTGRSSPSDSRSRTRDFNSKVQPLVKLVSSTREADSLYLLGTRSDD